MVPKDHWKIELKKTAFITIDMQRAFLEQGAPGECTESLLAGHNTVRHFVTKVNELADMCRCLGIPVIHTRFSTRPDLLDIGLLGDIRPRTDSELEAAGGRKGVEFCEGLKVNEHDYIVTKIRYSAFVPGASSLEPLLRGLGRDSFIVCGLATDVCVGQSVADAMELGYKAFVVGDLTATCTEERRRVALEVLDMHYAKVVTFKEVRQELEKLATRTSSR